MIDDLIAKGSKTAKDGFKNEYDVIDKFNNWQTDTDAREWLSLIGYDTSEVQSVIASKVVGVLKSDIQVHIKTFSAESPRIEMISVKLVSNQKNGFNQIDKRRLAKYSEMWNIPKDVYDILALYTGESLPPAQLETRDPRRMFMDEMSVSERTIILAFFEANKIAIISDILAGRGEFMAKWILVAATSPDMTRYTIKPMRTLIDYYNTKPFKITAHGNINIGGIGIQRKGGDNGRETAKCLQFKMDPLSIFSM